MSSLPSEALELIVAFQYQIATKLAFFVKTEGLANGEAICTMVDTAIRLYDTNRSSTFILGLGLSF